MVKLIAKNGDFIIVEKECIEVEPCEDEYFLCKKTERVEINYGYIEDWCEQHNMEVPKELRPCVYDCEFGLFD